MIKTHYELITSTEKRENKKTKNKGRTSMGRAFGDSSEPAAEGDPASGVAKGTDMRAFKYSISRFRVRLSSSS